MKSSYIFGIIIAAIGGYLAYKYYYLPKTQAVPSASQQTVSSATQITPSNISQTTTTSTNAHTARTLSSLISNPPKSALTLGNTTSAIVKNGTFITNPTTNAQHVVQKFAAHTASDTFVNPISKILQNPTSKSATTSRIIYNVGKSSLIQPVSTPKSTISSILNVRNPIAQARFPSFPSFISSPPKTPSPSSSQVHIPNPITFVQSRMSPFAHRFMA